MLIQFLSEVESEILAIADDCDDDFGSRIDGRLRDLARTIAVEIERLRAKGAA